MPHYPYLFWKKVSGKNLHFLHHAMKIPIKTYIFRCRKGCRILLSLRAILHQQHHFGWLRALFRVVWCRMQKGKVSHAKPYLTTIEDSNTKSTHLECILDEPSRETFKNPAVLCYVRHGIIGKCMGLCPQKRQKQDKKYGKCRKNPTYGLYPTPYPLPEILSE